MAKRSNIGDLFLQFLKAQNHLEAFNRLDSDSVSDAEINSIFSKYRADFDAWLKIPRAYKDAYGRAKPEMMEAAKNDPNFTESDAKAVQENSRASSSPYSFMPKAFSEDPLLEGIFIGAGGTMLFTPAHAAKIKLKAESLQRTGYSTKASDKMADYSLAIKALFEKINQIELDPSLSDAEKKRQKDIAYKQIDCLRTEMVKTGKNDIYKNIPERGIMFALRACKKGTMRYEDAVQKVDAYVKQISKSGRMEELAVQMSGAVYTKILQEEQRSILHEALLNNGIDIKMLEAMARDYAPKPIDLILKEEVSKQMQKAAARNQQMQEAILQKGEKTMFNQKDSNAIGGRNG